MIKNKKARKVLYFTISRLPLAGIVYGTLLPLQRFGQQMMMLAFLIWLQVFFVFEILLSGRSM